MPRFHGPWGPIPYVRDALGFPRIRVRHRAESAYALGWMHGHDRQAQVRLLLATAQGRLMEILGDQPLTRAVDRSVHTMGLTRDLDAQFESLDADTQTLGATYCEGFERGAEDGGTPALLRLLPTLRQPYRPRDMIALVRLTGWFGLNSLTQTSSLLLAHLVSTGAPERLLRRLYGEAADDIDPGIASGLKLPTYLTSLFTGGPSGSNAFAVTGSRSATGKPLLMGEFHMEVGKIPPVMYAAHLDIDDEDDFVHGVSIAGLPTIASGRNRHCAWSYTFGHAANVQITLERCRGGAHERDGVWHPLERRDVTVKVRGEDAELWTFWDGEPGTVFGDASGETVTSLPAMRWYGFERTFQDLQALGEVSRCQTVDQLLEVHARVEFLSLAGTFADTRGQLGYLQTGSVTPTPTRWAPAPGWRPPPSADIVRPRTLNPESQYIASANEAHAGWTAFPEPPYRHARLTQLLGSDGPLAASDLLRVSYDEFDGLSHALAHAWHHHFPAHDRAAFAMLHWARTQGARQSRRGRTHMARMHALHRAVIHALICRDLPASDADWMVAEPSFILGIQDHLDPLLCGAVPSLLSDVEIGALVREAWTYIKDATLIPGENTPVVHSTRFHGDLERGKLPAALGFSSAPVELPGGPVCLFQSRRSVVAGHAITTGPAFHLLMDLSTTTSRYNLAGGASERWRLPGYAKGLKDWSSGRLIALGEGPPPAR